MDKNKLTEELEFLNNNIEELSNLITQFGRVKKKKSEDELNEEKDMKLQLSAMNLYKLYLEKRISRIK